MRGVQEGGRACAGPVCRLGAGGFNLRIAGTWCGMG